MSREGDIEEVVSAFRERTPDGRVLPSSRWRDLDRDARRAAYEDACRQRVLEAALDEDGLSSTARAVLSRIRRDG